MRYSSSITDQTDRRPFDFSANHIVLDFTNTVNARPLYSRDDLRGPDDLSDWASAAGMAHHGVVVSPDAEGSQHFAAAIALREHIYHLFGPIAAGDDPHSAAVAFVARRAAHGVRSTPWVRGSAGYEPQWVANSIEGWCDRLADEAMQLLRSPATSRIGCCAGCGWLFLDTSRGHARRWCSMNVCGVRDKMRRYHHRQSMATSSL
jgi:predicted RNA-binding Zn ribbon-like protein